MHFKFTTYKLRNALSPLFFNYVPEYFIRKVLKNQDRLEMFGHNQVLVYIEDKLISENINLRMLWIFFHKPGKRKTDGEVINPSTL
jgi:poly(3-hydroxyalkanoate) synthetase